MEMEDVLEVYARPYDPLRPQVCLDEAAKQILSEVRAPLARECGQVERVDHEYQREGTSARAPVRCLCCSCCLSR